MAQRVQFIATVLHEPSLVVLDEPFSDWILLARTSSRRRFGNSPNGVPRCCFVATR